MGFLGNDLWLSGHELEPGVKVLDGLLSASEAQSIMDFPFLTLTPYIAIFLTSRCPGHCTNKKTSIGHSTFGYLSPCSAESKTDFDDALKHTADTLCLSLDTFDSLFCHSDDTPPSLVESSPPKRLGVPVQPHYPKQANHEMFKAGLTQSSRLLHPFSQPDGSDDRDLPPQCTFTLDPFSEEYHEKLHEGLHLDCDEYSHVDSAVIALLRTYPHAFLLPSAPPRRIHGTEHHINTGNSPLATRHHTRCQPLSSRQCVIKLMTCLLATRYHSTLKVPLRFSSDTFTPQGFTW